MTTDLRRTALHEAGHSYVAWRLGVTVGPVTIEPGRRWAGMAHFSMPLVPTAEIDAVDLEVPYVLWPPAVRHSIDTSALVAAAGDAAEETLYRVAGRYRDPITERVTELAAAAPLTAAERRTVDNARLDTARKTDDEQLAELLNVAHANDHQAGAHWLAYITAAARACITTDPAAVHRLADQLIDHRSLSGRAVASILGATP